MAVSAGEIMNGERAVVILFVGRVVSSVPSSLLFEVSSLVLLSVAGLLLEIAADSADLSKFNTRRGASSGILLGAVTLPTVLLSRLIQMWRMLDTHDVGYEGSVYLDLQYWAVSAGCFGVLLFIFLVMRQSPTSANLSQQRNFKDSMSTGMCIILYAFLCCLSPAKGSFSGSYFLMALFWLLLHGLATVLFIQFILQTFPSCASMGEALLVASGLVLYFGDMLIQTLTKISLSLSSNSYLVRNASQDDVNKVIQGMLLGLLLLPIMYRYVLRICFRSRILKVPAVQHVEGVRDGVIGTSIAFYGSLSVMLTMIVPAWMYFVQDFHVHPALWVLNFVFTEPHKRLALCVYWISVISVSVFRFYNISKHSKTERILLRKYYHLVAVLMFVPALLFQPTFLDVAFGAALAVFLILEMIRIWKIWPLGSMIHQFMNAFTDHRDSEILIVSHFSLLLGCALPKWMSSGSSDRPLAAFAGILSLGIGDTMASMVGHKYGVLRWSKTGKKTIEGTAAGITSVLAACSILLPLLASTGYIASQHWFSLVVAVCLSGLLEAYTAQLDNAFIPLVFYSLLCL